MRIAWCRTSAWQHRRTGTADECMSVRYAGTVGTVGTYGTSYGTTGAPSQVRHPGSVERPDEILPPSSGPSDQGGGVFYSSKGRMALLIRDIDGPAMTAASVESCQFVVLRSPWGRLGSVFFLVACNRLRRMRRRFPVEHFRPILSARRPEPKSPRFGIQSSLESPKHRRMRRRRLPDPRPIPEGVQEPICIRKK